MSSESRPLVAESVPRSTPRSCDDCPPEVDTRLEVDTRMKALRAAANERIAAIPALAAFVRAVEQSFVPSDEESFWCCEAAFRALTESTFLTGLVNLELGKFLADPLYVSPVNSAQLVVLETDWFKLSADFVDRRTLPATTQLQSLPAHSMFVIKLAPLTIARYLQPEPFPAEVFRRDAPLQHLGTERYEVESLVRLRAGYDLLDFLPDDGETPLILSFVSKISTVGYCWTYDKATLQPVRYLAAHPNWSRIDYAAKIIAQVGDADCLPALVRLGREHPSHFVRWSAIQSVVRLGFETGMQMLAFARQDAHPHVRRAAEKTLERFSAIGEVGG